MSEKVELDEQWRVWALRRLRHVVVAYLMSLLTVSAAAAAPGQSRDSANERAPFSLKKLSAKASSGKAAVKGPSANSGQAIELMGSGFDPSVTVEFFGFAGSAFVVNPSKVTAKKITVIVPGAAVTGPVRVLKGAGAATATLKLQVVPVVASLPAVLPTTQLLIDGTGFAYHTQVFFPGVKEPITPTIASPTRLDLTVPSGIRSGKLTVATSGGRSQPVSLSLQKSRQVAASKQSQGRQ